MGKNTLAADNDIAAADSVKTKRPKRSKPAKSVSKPPKKNSDKADLPKRAFKTHGGVHAKHMKNTAETPSEVMPIPSRVVISMQPHIGAPCVPSVKVGDSVTMGQKIANSKSPVSAPVHSSVSGKVKSIGTITAPNGAEVQTIEIESDGLQTQCDGIYPPTVTNRSELCDAIRESGLVGLGGAGFPVSVKLNYPDDKNVDTLVINGAECEPYLTADYREMMENTDDVVEGANLLYKLLGVKRVIFGIESNKPAAIKKIRLALRESSLDDKICVLKLEASYPHGAEKVLIKACTGRVVPSGKIPADAGCVVLNITSVAFIARYLRTGMPLVSKRVTVDGSSIAKRKNVIVPIGTLVSDIAEFCGGFKEPPEKILTGGPMMGTALCSMDYPIKKQDNGLLFLSKDEAKASQMTSCIRCAKCVDVCPMLLCPVTIQQMVEARDKEALLAAGVLNCMECGCCAYSCPANRPLVQFMRMGKTIAKGN